MRSCGAKNVSYSRLSFPHQTGLQGCPPAQLCHFFEALIERALSKIGEVIRDDQR